MNRVIVVHWNAGEAAEKVQFLVEAGFDVEPYDNGSREQMLAIREQPPDAFVIDLSRLPSQGLSFAIWLRQQKNTHKVPLLFCGGAPEKKDRARQALPDAVYTDWDNICTELRQAIDHPLPDPVVPGTFDAYSGTPLPKKLGLRDGAITALFHAPPEFEQKLTPLPTGCTLVRMDNPSGITKLPGIILLFVRSQSELDECFPVAAEALAKNGRIWIAWQKKASGISTDLSERSVRSFGLEKGFVDYKISSIDETWSGLCFTLRKAAVESG